MNTHVSVVCHASQSHAMLIKMSRDGHLPTITLRTRDTTVRTRTSIVFCWMLILIHPGLAYMKCLNLLKEVIRSIPLWMSELDIEELDIEE